MARSLIRLSHLGVASALSTFRRAAAAPGIGGLFGLFSGSVVSLGAQTLTITNGSFFYGAIQDGGIAGGTGGGLTIAGGATQQLAGTNTYTGLTTINATVASLI